MTDWTVHVERERERYRDGESRLPEDADARQRQLTRLGNAATGAGLSCLMLGRRDDAAVWLDRAARRYRVLQSFETRDAYLEDVPVADTVLVLQALARRRGLAAELRLRSTLLPA